MTKEQKEYSLTLKRVIRNEEDNYSNEEVQKALKKLLDFLTAIEDQSV